MKKNSYEALTDNDLQKKRNLLKGASVGLGIVFILAFATFAFLLATKGFKNIPMAAFIPIFAMPATFMPLLVNLGLLNKEIKSRNL